MIDFEEDDIVLCTVKRIEGTTVFLEMDDYPGIQAAMIFAEVSAGRIRNIRDFVSPGKKIVCKILRIKGNSIELSLRRVTGKEREQLMDRYKKEKQFQSMLKPVLKEKTLEVYRKIREDYDIAEFIEEARENPKIIENFMTKSEAEQLSKILLEKKEKAKEVISTITIKSTDPDGINRIKDILKTSKAEIRYKGSSQFAIGVKTPDFKTANHIMDSVLAEIKEKAKKLNVKIEIKEK
ncbi:hypothetical protein CO038_03170 [Candidatus Pacearchaeota archaeon CG_4_9_14_0_2_um_filter_39_13]|nr:hypothetical protein [Candidatus Pacearchaeota archaeon]OIO42650.1 MAG: hypothetical protein AUJ64_03705 [Candidatus Pacearchaeota archaeon CG1_02_39_14]PJC44567.1 MAG: hypothetical protein CO038_03170 [Candidatus Pacearchaeota archaeon CG_4_9_14_0_2_um_filter_39_13]